MPEKILITGANGFIGENVVNAFLEKEYDVLAISRRGSTIPNVESEVIDITEGNALDARLKSRDVDGIIHLASLPGDTGDPIQMVKVNILGYTNVLEFARSRGIKKVVLASSTSAYEWYPATAFSQPDYLPVDEKHACRPKDMYSSTKRMQEILSMTYYHQYKVNICALRLVAVVGPKGRGGGRSWRVFAEQLLSGKSIEIPFFTENEICHFVDVRDVARMCVTAFEEDGANGELFNCAGPNATSGIEMEKIIREIRPDIRIQYGYPWSMAQGGELYFNMEKAEKRMGFKPIYSIRDSIQYIYEWALQEGVRHNSDKIQFGTGVKKEIH